MIPSAAAEYAGLRDTSFLLLRVEGLSTMLDGQTIVDSVSLEVRRGEVLGIVGANGSGKTTLLRTIAGLLDPESGSVQIDSLPGSELSYRDRAKMMAYMPQQAEQHPFIALETVLMGRYPHLGRFELEGADDREMAYVAMGRTGTAEFANRRLDTLSGGERQRVVLARVLVQQANLLLMDEPTASLDLHHQILTMDIVREEADGRKAGVIVIMHDLSLAARFCDRLLVLYRGHKIAEGTPWEVLTPENLRTAFNIEGLVEPDPVTGKPHVLVLGSKDSNHGELAGSGRTVHLICGAGSGRRLMYQLRVSGYTVTAGVLGIGDSDREAAERLGVKYVGASPFSEINDSQHSEHIELIRASDHIVLCPMAVGMNNLRNIEAAVAAGSLIVVESPDQEISDFTDGKGHELRGDLVRRNGQVPESSVLFELARLASR